MSARHRGRVGAGALFALAVALGSAPERTLAQDPGLDVLAEAGARYAAVDTLCASFVQRLEIPLLGDERTGSGRLCQARPNLFAMRFTDPEGDAIVADGEAVWVYFPSNDPRSVLKASPDRSAGGRDFHREFLEDTSERYEVRYEVEDELEGLPTHRIRLVPRSRANYRAAVLWIDRGEPVLRQVRIEEENGNVRTITLSDVEFDAAPGAGWFSFTPPAGALVITG